MLAVVDMESALLVAQVFWDWGPSVLVYLVVDTLLLLRADLLALKHYGNPLAIISKSRTTGNLQNASSSRLRLEVSGNKK